jgi:hypothetical protein
MRWAVRASTAIFGFAVAIALSPRLQFPARPSDLPSALKAAGFSPTGLVLQFIAAVLVTAIFAVIGERVARVVAAYRWAAISYCITLLLAPVTLMSYGNLRHLALHAAVAVAIVALRERDPHFALGDVVLIPVFLSCHIALLDIGFGRTPIATALRAAMIVFALRLIVRSADAMTASALALVAQTGWLPPKIGAALALIVIAVVAFVRLRLPRRVVYPIAIFAYPLAVLATSASVVNIFEDSHEIPVAAEMLRGERPYTDIIPMHGFFADGGISYVAMKLGARSLPALLMVRRILGASTGVAIYCVALAATGSAEAALLAAFLAFSMFAGSSIWLRPSAALFALAATVAAVRLRSRRWFIAAGALVVIAYLLSVDFGTYSAIVALFAAVRARALRPLAIGLAIAAAPFALLFLAFGFLADFVRVNAVEIFGNRGAYFIHPIEFPDCLRTPSFFDQLGNADCVNVLVWIVALIATCAALARWPLRGRRSDARWLIGVWIVIAAATYVDRRNVYFNVAAAAFIVAALQLLWRRARPAAMAIIVVLFFIAHPFRHVISLIPSLRQPREQALFDPTTATSVKAATKFISTLPPDQTFVDLSNTAMVYYLTNRDIPLRRLQIGMMESDAAQREVIAAIERNPRVQAALVDFAGSVQAIDGVTGAQRAPLIWQYLEQHFTPAFDEDGVVFWRRR